jgi:hypothetical protein
LTFDAILGWRDALNEGKMLLRDIIDLDATYGGSFDGTVVFTPGEVMSERGRAPTTRRQYHLMPLLNVPHMGRSPAFGCRSTGRPPFPRQLNLPAEGDDRNIHATCWWRLTLISPRFGGQG